jgi:hypothetical protein
MLRGDAEYSRIEALRQLDEFPENNGNTYMLFTAAIAGSAPLCIVLLQQVNVLAVRILFAIYAALTVLAAFANIASFFWRTWAGQIWELSPLRVLPPTGLARLLGRVPWRVWRLFDCYGAWNAAVANVMVSFWSFDTDPLRESYWVFCALHRGCQNIWGAWLWSLYQAVTIFNAASEPMHARGLFAAAFSGVAGTVSWLFITFVFVAVVTQTVEITKLQFKEMKEARASRLPTATAAEPRRDPRTMAATAANF